ncbi:major capsid protein [Nonomuraea sp. NPDC026600]|uniref:major capsid protein n=1 Tax=Nonomuraea sp. NPDC026600 TaxID=3155363 RepID=UPI0033E7D344
MTLQELLDLIAAGDGDALAAALNNPDINLGELESAALAAFQDIRARQSEGLSAEDMTALEALADGVEALRGETTRRDQVVADQAARADAIESRIAPPVADAAGADDVDQDDGGADAAIDGHADAGAGDGDAAQGAEPVLDTVAASATPNPPPVPAVPARRPRVNLGALRNRAPAPAPPNGDDRAMLVAAANVPGFNSGAELEMNQVAQAAISRFAVMPRPESGHEGRVQHSVALVRKRVDPQLVADGADDDGVLDFAANERRLPGGSLIEARKQHKLSAAGGWCAPSETWYDIACERETTAGLLSIPEVTASRGGIRWTQGPDFAELFSHAGYFIQTEAQADAAVEKPCFEIPCEDFLECRLDAIGLCLSAGILTARAWPELIARFIRGSLTAHAHRYSGTTIARIVAGSTAVALPPAQFSAAVDVLGSIDLQATDYRYRHRMDPNATLEVVAPYWLLGVLRSDYAKRNAVDNPYMVSDAEIVSWFAARGVSVQFVYNWQDGFSTPAGTIGAAVPPTTWPASVQILLYAAGTWVRATQDIITLDAVYDSTLFRINRYNAIFTEEGLCVIQRCPDSRLLTIPICATGYSADQVPVVCPSI